MDRDNLDFDFDKFVEEQVEKAVAAKLAANQPPNPAPTNPAPTAQPITVELDGVKYQFNSEAELNNALTTWRTQTQAELAKLSTAPKPAPTVGVSGDDKPKWDMERFVSLMTENPVAAFDYVDGFRYFDGKVENASKVIKERLDRADAMEKTLAAEQFRQLHPEFPITDAAATSVVDQVRTQLGLPFTVQGLEAAYYTAVNTNPAFRNHIQQIQQQQQPTQQPPQNAGYNPPNTGYNPNYRPGPVPVPTSSHPYANMGRPANNPYLMAPPPISRNSEPAPHSGPNLDALDSLSADELRNLIEKSVAGANR